MGPSAQRQHGVVLRAHVVWCWVDSLKEELSLPATLALNCPSS